MSTYNEPRWCRICGGAHDFGQCSPEDLARLTPRAEGIEVDEVDVMPYVHITPTAITFNGQPAIPLVWISSEHPPVVTVSPSGPPNLLTLTFLVGEVEIGPDDT